MVIIIILKVKIFLPTLIDVLGNENFDLAYLKKANGICIVLCVQHIGKTIKTMDEFSKSSKYLNIL